jgi:hypothetical protein
MNSEADSEPDLMRKRRGIKLPALMVGASLVILAGIIGYAMNGKFSETNRADQATVQSQNQQAQAKALALGIKKACAQKVPEVAAYCSRAQQVIEQKPIEGPQGIQGAVGPVGPQGSAGPTGKPGANATGVPGKPGPSGRPGANATGIPGAQGSPGGSGPEGPQGSPGPGGPEGSPGAPGSPGAAGQNGNGIVSVECSGDQLQTFRFTFTDGTTQTVECAPSTTPSPTADPTLGG